MDRDAREERDLEEDRDLLDADEGMLEFWERKQREVVLSVVDYNLPSLARLVEEDAIDVDPAYQRRERWDNNRQSKLIESFLINVPVPPVFLHEGKLGSYAVIDGKQRLLSIAEFFSGRLTLTGLAVFRELNGKRISEMPPALRTAIETRPTLRTVIILHHSDPEIQFEVFERLNTGGVNLNAQEIRNSAFPGPLNDKILELSQISEFHRLLNIKPDGKEKSYIYQQMRDAEFVLRFFAFRHGWQDYSGGIKQRLDMYMAEHQHMEPKSIAQAEEEFRETLRVVEAAFGLNAFQRYQPAKGQWRNQVLAAAYDAQMIGCHGLSEELCRTHHAELVDGMKALFEDDRFLESVDAATNTASYFKTRIEMVRDMIIGIIGGN